LQTLTAIESGTLMKPSIVVLAFGLFAVCAYSQTSTIARPRITGIDHVSFYTTQPEGVKAIYGETLGLTSLAPVESGEMVRYEVGTQWVGYSTAPDPKAIDRMDHVAFITSNISELRRYLSTNGVRFSEVQERSDRSLSIFVNDPEGHKIEFVERLGYQLRSVWTDGGGPRPVSNNLIHVGFLVHNRDTEDHFYCDLLGFRLYWHGGMRPGETDWVAMQVPDGTDWVEYMLNHSEHPDLRLTGVLNHISLGVVDMKKTQAILESHGWKPNGNEKGQMGRDGKWQLNLFDPDLTRIELMEFKPVEKPCCAEFTGPHPSE
jgi:catechol 2,3-dioxygenase-like lactoylglutathione lyase family enzyme